MDHCEHLPTCEFFNDKMSGMPMVSEMLKERYCLDDWSSCARFRVASRGKQIPGDLFPDDDERALRGVGR